MRFFKRCQERDDCRGGRCQHVHHVDTIIKGFRIKGPVTKYMRLLPIGAKTPTSAEELKDLGSRIRVWAAQGCPDLAPLSPTVGDSADEAEAEYDLTMAQLCDDYLTKHVSKMGCKASPGQVRRIKAVAGDEPLTWLSDQRAIGDFLDDLVEQAEMRKADNVYSNRNGHLRRLSHLLTFARIHHGYEGTSPFKHRQFNPTGLDKINEGKGRHRRLQDWEEAGLVKAFAGYDDGGMMLGRFYCALDCGLRRGEMLELTKKDLKWNHQGDGLYIHLRWTTTKSEKERYVPVTSQRLQAFLETRKDTPFIFGQADGTRCSQFRIEWENALIAADIDEGEWVPQVSKTGKRWGKWVRSVDGDLHWHDLRHEYASRLHENGQPLMDICYLLGHHSVEVTQRYINVTDKGIRARQQRAQAALGL